MEQEKNILKKAQTHATKIMEDAKKEIAKKEAVKEINILIKNIKNAVRDKKFPEAKRYYLEAVSRKSAKRIIHRKRTKRINDKSS